MLVDPSIIEHRIEALRAFDRWPAAEVDRFCRALEVDDDWQLFRINPLHFAEREGFAPQVAVELFLYGVKVGLFDLVWTCVCVFCGAVEYTNDTIDRVPRRSFHCTRCDADIASWLDERVEVSFSIHRSVAVLAINPFADLRSYTRYHTSPNIVHEPGTAAFLASVVRDHAMLEADGRAELWVSVPPGGSRRLVSYDRHAQLLLVAEPSAEPDSDNAIEIDLLATGFASETVAVRPGELRLHLFNRAPEPTGVVVLDGEIELFQHQVETHRASVQPFLSGQMLLCTQSFRQLFRVQTLDEELALNVRYVALLFTDLVASTHLYEQVGDAAAYGLIRKHFRELHAATEAHGGAVVKTMGDAIMASFCSSADAVRAAVDMLDRIDRLNLDLAAEPNRHGVDAIRLRVGVHAGTALVVHAQGHLDYFGQVVNIAARLQTLAAAGTLCLSTEVLRAPGVAKLFERTTSKVREPEQLAIRGLLEPMWVCRVDLGTVDETRLIR